MDILETSGEHLPCFLDQNDLVRPCYGYPSDRVPRKSKIAGTFD